MAQEELIADAVPAEPRARRLHSRVLRWLGIAMIALLVLFAGVVGWLHTNSGREFVDEQIAEVSMTRRSEVRTPPDHVPKAGQKLNQQRHRIGFRVWFHQGDELTR